MYRILALCIVFMFIAHSMAQNGNRYLKAERYTFSESAVSIQPPLYFDTTHLYKGLLHKATSSSLVASKAPDRNPIAFNQGLTKDYFLSQQLTLLKSEKISTATWEGMLYYLSFKVKDVQMQRMMLVTGSYNDTYILMANFPDMFSSQLTIPIRESMLTLSF